MQTFKNALIYKFMWFYYVRMVNAVDINCMFFIKNIFALMNWA